MLLEVIDENGTKKFRQLSGTTSDGIPLGSYVSVEGNAVPDGFLECDGSTFDTAAYPALAMLLGSNTLPVRFDHSILSDWEAITLSNSSSSPTEMAYDGFLKFGYDGSNSLSDGNIYVNGVDTCYVRCQGYDGYSGYSAAIPVKKGDLVYYSSNIGLQCKVRFYKKHMLIKAVPGHVEDTTGLFNQIKDYVDQGQSYSTSETLTGGTWIDGKPIYRKVVVSSTQGTMSAGGSWYTITTEPTAESVIDLKLIDIGSGTRWLFTNILVRTGLYDGQIAVCPAGQGFSAVASGSTRYAIIEYTKTTD